MSADYDDLIISLLNPPFFAKLTDTVGEDAPVDSGTLGLTGSAADVTFGADGLTNGDPATACTFGASSIITFTQSAPAWTAMTVIATVKPSENSSNTNDADKGVIASDDSTGWIFGLTSNRMRFWTNTSSEAVASDTFTITPGTVYHVAFTINADKEWVFYLNGAAVGSGTAANAPLMSADIHVGYWDGSGWRFRGQMQYVAIDDAAATAQNIEDLYDEWLSSGVPTISSAVMQEDGKRIRLTFSATGAITGTTGFTPKIGGVSKTVGAMRQISASVVDLWIENPDTVVTGNTVTYDYDSGAGDFADGAGDLASVTAGAVTNNSLQTATKIVYPIQGTSLVQEFTFASIVERAYTASMRWRVKTGSVLNSTTPAQTGTGATRRHGSMINPAFTDRKHAFDGRLDVYDETLEVTFPHTFAAGESMLSAYSTGEEIGGGWPSETAVDVGEWITEGSRQVVITAGTTSAVEPTWADLGDTYTDGTAEWETYGNHYLEAATIIDCYSGTCPSVTDFAPPYVDATKTIYSSTGMLARLPAGLTAPVGLPAITTTLNETLLPLIEVEGTFVGQFTRPYRNLPRTGLTLGSSFGKSLTQVMVNQSYREQLLIQCVQAGIDYNGIFEIGGRINDGGGHSWGRSPFAWLAGVALDEEATFDAPFIADAENFIEFATTFNVTQSQINSGVYDYNVWRLTTSSITGTPTGTITGDTSMATGTYLRTEGSTIVVYNVTGDFEAEDVSFSGGSATVTSVLELANTFPATVQESYLYVPEWKFGTAAVDGATSPDKWWNVAYRECCSFAGTYPTAAMLAWLDKDTTFDDGQFLDYQDRYEYVERVEDGDDFTHDTEWQYLLYTTNRATLRGAFAVTAASFNPDTQVLTITANRYATSIDGDGFALTGGLTLSNFAQTGPTTFTFDVDGDATGETLAYVAQSAPDEFVDASNSELPAFAGMALDEAFAGARPVIVSGGAADSISISGGYNFIVAE
jgi:hypothetical protein